MIILIVPDGQGNFTLSFPQRCRKTSQGAQIKAYTLQPEARLQQCQNPFLVRSVTQFGRVKRQQHHANHRVDRDNPFHVGFLAHNLTIRLGFLRHRHQQVALNEGHTAQAHPSRQTAPGADRQFSRIRGADVCGVRRQVVFGEMSLLDDHLALAAGARAAADGFNPHSQSAGSLQNRGPGWHPPSASRWLEYHLEHLRIGFYRVGIGGAGHIGKMKSIFWDCEAGLREGIIAIIGGKVKMECTSMQPASNCIKLV